jgi:hypothetical protein
MCLASGGKRARGEKEIPLAKVRCWCAIGAVALTTKQKIREALKKFGGSIATNRSPRPPLATSKNVLANRPR